MPEIMTIGELRQRGIESNSEISVLTGRGIFEHNLYRGLCDDCIVLQKRMYGHVKEDGRIVPLLLGIEARVDDSDMIVVYSRDEVKLRYVDEVAEVYANALTNGGRSAEITDENARATALRSVLAAVDCYQWPRGMGEALLPGAVTRERLRDALEGGRTDELIVALREARRMLDEGYELGL
jgi:hypothetical protein